MSHATARRAALAGLAAFLSAASVPLAPDAWAQSGRRAAPPTLPAVQPPAGDGGAELAGADAGAAPPGGRPPIVVAPDRRIPMVVKATERARFLEDMRQYLSVTQSMLASLAQRDMLGVAQGAREMAQVNIHDLALASETPYEAEFRELATSVQRDFRRIADEAPRHGDAKQTLGQLGIAMQKCLACHRTFQLSEWSPPFPAPSRVGDQSRPVALAGAEFNTSESADRRVPLVVRPNERSYILRNMRLYLTGMQTTLVALSQDDWKTVADTATSMGRINIYDVSLSYASKYDVSFRDMALETHQDFDVIAKDAARRDTDHTLGQLATTMGKCMACHRTYQLRDAAHSGTEALMRPR